jgi:hypothetical protein
MAFDCFTPTATPLMKGARSSPVLHSLLGHLLQLLRGGREQVMAG